MKQRGDDGHLRTVGAKTIVGLHTSLISGDQSCKRQRHVQRVLPVVVSRVAAVVARIATREEAFKVVKSQP